jgi:hypothetical protein
MRFKELFWYYPYKNEDIWQTRRYLRNWVSNTATVLGISMALVALISTIVGIALAVDKYDCRVFQENTGIETKHKSLTCYANYKGEWVEKQNIILTIEGKK